MNRRVHVDRLYEILGELRARVGGFRYLTECDGRSGWPRQGVYFFFEPGEVREDGRTMRVVRVGTHAVSQGSKATLWSRLAWHKGRVGGAFVGGGGHRGSLFRRHVGLGLLNRGGYPVEIRQSWGRGSTTSAELRRLEYPLERDVSKVIRRMPLLWVGIADEAGVGSRRGFIERNAIALLSNYARAAIDRPSENWLGRDSSNGRIRESGLWNVDCTDLINHDPRFLDILAQHVAQMRPI